MAIFNYKAIDQEGAVKTGIIEAETVEIAQSDLAHQQGLSILHIKTAGKFSVGLKGFKRKIKRPEVIEFATNLSVIMKAGVPLLDALEDISQTLENKHLREAANDIKERIRTGVGFSEALAFHKDIFPDILIRLATVGEETGRLEQSIQEVADHLQRLEDLKNTVKQSLIYPIFAFVMVGGALLFWLFYVLPKIIGVLKDMNIELPFLTRVLIKISDFSTTYWYLGLIVPACLFIIFKIIAGREGARYYIDYLKIKLPIIKSLVFFRLMAVFSEQLKILIVSGITIDRSLLVVANAVGSEVIKKVLYGTREKIMTGSRISDALRQYPVFPALVIRMVDVGESSGSLDSQFAFLSNYYYKKLENASAKVGKSLEPILIITLGIMIAVIMIAVLLPIYGIMGKIEKG
jgi:type II secretory pathway component PulF